MLKSPSAEKSAQVGENLFARELVVDEESWRNIGRLV